MKAVFYIVFSTLLINSTAHAKATKISLVDTAKSELSVNKSEVATDNKKHFSTVTVETISYEKPDYEFKKKFLFGFQNSGFSGSLNSLNQNSTSVADLSFSPPVVLGVEVPFYNTSNGQGSAYYNAVTSFSKSDISLLNSSGDNMQDSTINIFALAVGLGYAHKINSRFSLGAEVSRSAQRSVIPVVISSLQSSSANHYGGFSLLANINVYETYSLQLAQVTTFDGQLGELTPESGVRMLLRKEL